MKLPDRQILYRDLSLFADGELDPVSARALLRRLVDEPALAEELSRLQQMSNDARRVVLALTPAPSDALRKRLRPHDRSAVAPAGSDAPMPLRTWPLAKMAAAAVILLALGAGLGRWSSTPGARSVHRSQAIPVADVVPAGVISSAEEIHGVCSRLALGLHSGGYPSDVAALAGAVERDLHSEHPYPNLESIGYRYRGAGPCGRPLPDAAHLLYRSLKPGSVNAVSVFVQPWHGQYALQADRVFTVSIAESPFPMLAWRSDTVVYFLISDDLPTEAAALQLIRSPAVRAVR